jgi:hypothetical protein
MKIFVSALLGLKQECFFQFAPKCKNEKTMENFSVFAKISWGNLS